jgi:hypothetical protein
VTDVFVTAYFRLLSVKTRVRAFSLTNGFGEPNLMQPDDLQALLALYKEHRIKTGNGLP